MIVELNSISTISVLLLSPIKSQQPGHDSSICLVFLVLTVWGELCLISLESTLVNKPTLIVSRSSGARSWSDPRPHRPTRLREQTRTRIQSGCLPLSSTFWQVNIQMQTHAPPPWKEADWGGGLGCGPKRMEWKQSWRTPWTRKMTSGFLQEGMWGAEWHYHTSFKACSPLWPIYRFWPLRRHKQTTVSHCCRTESQNH